MTSNVLLAFGDDRAAGVSPTVTNGTLRSQYMGQSIAPGLTAAGTDLATAWKIGTQINIVTTTDTGTGVALPAVSYVGTGVTISIVNLGTNALAVYGSYGDTIDGTAGATGVSIDAAGSATYTSTAAGKWATSIAGSGGGGGPAGPQGPAGADGAQGDPGPQGPAGASASAQVVVFGDVWDVGQGELAYTVMNGTVTIPNPINTVDGGTYIMILAQDGSGGHAPAYGDMFKWAGGTGPVLSSTPSSINILTFVCYAGSLYGIASTGY